ncbi:MAG: tyrosine--tRNA ligase [Candidatus Thermoplasmatota archaeon]
MDSYELIVRNAVEVVTHDELRGVLQKDSPKMYIGFEPSGSVHLGWMICIQKMKDFLSAGFECIILLADWHAYINDKLGGNLEKIQLCGTYMEHCFAALGLDTSKIRFVYAHEYVGDSKYWELVLKTAKATSVARVKRAMDIMGRKEEDMEKDLSKLLYPVMQVSDIFYLDVDVAFGGMDQRHAHMLARDVARKLNRKSPVAVHTPLLSGLQAGSRMDPIESKMSKSKPDSMISIHDSSETVKRKLGKAFCPEKQVEGNPVLELCKYVIFPWLDGAVFVIERPEKFGGNLEFDRYDALENAFLQGIHPLDLKNAVATYITQMLEPVHRYFQQHQEVLEKMRSIGIIQ